MLYGDSFVYMSVLSYRGYGKIYNGKVNAFLHNESRTDFRLCGSGWCLSASSTPFVIFGRPLHEGVD